AEADARLERHRDALVDAGERLDREAQRQVVLALAAVLRREGEAEEAQVAHLRDDLDRQPALGGVPAGRGCDHLVGEPADGVVELLLFGGECVLHVVPPGSGWGVTTATTWSRRTRSPGRTRRLAMPAWGATSACSIFIASIVTRGCPASTDAP